VGELLANQLQTIGLGAMAGIIAERMSLQDQNRSRPRTS